MRVEIPYAFVNFNDATVEVWKWISDFIPHFPGYTHDYLSMLGANANENTL